MAEAPATVGVVGALLLLWGVPPGVFQGNVGFTRTSVRSIMGKDTSFGGVIPMPIPALHPARPARPRRRWAHPQPACPRCGSDRTHRHGFFRWKDGAYRRRFLCRSCGRTFNRHTDTRTPGLLSRATGDDDRQPWATNRQRGWHMPGQLDQARCSSAGRWAGHVRRGLSTPRLHPPEPARAGESEWQERDLGQP